MEIRIPRHLSASAITKVRSKELVRRILKEADVRILKKIEMRGKPMEIEAYKILRNGRIHIKGSSKQGFSPNNLV